MIYSNYGGTIKYMLSNMCQTKSIKMQKINHFCNHDKRNFLAPYK